MFYELYGGRKSTQKNISERAGIPKQTVNSVVRKLKKEGFVRLESGNKDRREKYVFLTDNGRNRAEEIVAPLMEAEEQICRQIGGERFNDMIETTKLYNLLFERILKERE